MNKETGKNLPDTALIKEMSKDFKISIDDILNGEYSKRKKNFKGIIIFSISFILIAIFLSVTILMNQKEKSFEFKTIVSNCSDFELSGNISYNNLKSSIYINNISYCGEENTDIYKNIKCTLYEKNNDSRTIIDTCNYEKEEQITLETFLKQVSFVVDNYQKMCKTYSNDSLYLEIEAQDEANKYITYKIPLKLESGC